MNPHLGVAAIALLAAATAAAQTGGETPAPAPLPPQPAPQPPATPAQPPAAPAQPPAATAPPGAWQQQPAPPPPATWQQQPAPTQPGSWQGAPAPGQPSYPPADAGVQTSAQPARATFDPWRLAVQTEAAFGVSGPFYNHLAGARIDRRFSQATSLGVYLGYVNVKGKAGRDHNVLGYVQLDHRLGVGGSIALPLRFATGYLPNNGPYLRLASGMAVDFDGFEIVIDLLAPTLWVTHNEAVLSLDLAAEAAWTF